MAKKDRLNYGSMDWDASLDFDFDDTPPKAKGSRKGNKPISHIVDGVTDSMTSKFTDPAHLRSMMRKALPSGFGKAWDAIDQVGQDITRLQDEATKELRPHFAHLTRKIDNLVPESAGRVKRFTQALKDKLDSGSRVENYETSFEEQTNQGVERMLASLEEMRDARDDHRQQQTTAREMVRDRVDDKRFAISQGTLNTIANTVIAERRYREGFDISYKKKSLELQFRSYAAMTSLLNNFVQFSKRTAKYQDANLVNTSLPEYAKTSTTQRWKANAQESLFNKANQSLFSKKSRVGLAGERLMRAGREKIGNIKDFTTLLSDALDMATDTMELDKDMAEIEGRESSGWRTAGSFGGSILGDYLSDFLSGKMKDFLKKSPGAMKKSFQVGRFANNPGELIKMARNSERLKKLRNSDSETDNKIADGLTSILNLLRAADPDMEVKNMGIGGEYENRDLTRTRTSRTINEIIPGYLARQLQVMMMIQSGSNKVPLLQFDARSGRFKTENRISAELAATLRKTARTSSVGTETYSQRFNKYSEAFLGDHKVSDKYAPEVRKFLGGLSRSADDFAITDTGLKDTAEYKSLSTGARRAIDRILKARFSGDSMESEANRYRLSARMSDTRDGMGDLTGIIENAIAEGQAPALIRAGIIRRGKGGGYIVDRERYYAMYDSTVRTIKSDVNAKTNIKYTGQGAQAAVNAFRNTKMADWQYKGQTARYRGPMAQDIRRNFGEATAPHGRQIDLVNMNGHMTDAIKGIIEKIDRMNSGEDQKLLANINANIEKLVRQGTMMTGVGGAPGEHGGGDGNSFNINTPIGAIAYLAQSAFRSMNRTAKRVGRTAMAVGDATVDRAQGAWNRSAGLREDMVRQGVLGLRYGFNKAVRFGQNMRDNIIPDMVERGNRLKNSAINTAKNIFQRTQDIYVEGRQSVALSGELLRLGYYYDAATGKVLKTMDDVTKAIGDIKGADGEVALALKDRAKGLLNGSGEKIKSFMGAMATNAVAGGLMLAGFGKDQYRKFKGHFGSGMRGIKNMMTGGRRAIMDKLDSLSNFGFGGGSDPRIVPVLLQIRDLMAMGKRGKAVNAILSRPIGNAPVMPGRRTGQNDPSQIDENPDQVNTSLMTQVRDLLAADKPADVVREILSNRGRTVGEFLKAPVNGPKMKKLIEKFKNANGEGKGGSGGIGAPAMFGPAPQMVGPMQPDAPQNTGGIGGVLTGMMGLGGALAGAGGGMLDKLGKRFPGARRRGRGLGRRLGNSRLGRLFGRGKREAGGIMDSVKGMFPGANGKEDKSQNQARHIVGTNTYSAATHASRLAGMDQAQELKGYNETGGGLDGNGDGRRDGGIMDRMAGLLNRKRANEERAQAAKDAAKAAADAKADRNRPEDDAIEKMIAMATKGIAAMTAGAGDILDTAADTLGDAAGDGPDRGRGRGRRGRGARGGGGKGGLFRRSIVGGASALWKGASWTVGKLTSLGKGIKNVMSLVPGASRVARVGMAATRAAQVVGLMGGGAGSVVTGGLGLVGSVISSPVVVGAAAVTGIGYGGYKLYKYFTKNSIDDYQKIRVLQYGLDGTDATKTYNSKVMALEDYLLDGKLAFQNGIPSLNARTIEMKDVYELFDIADDDSGMKNRFNEWFGQRFKPTFLHHVATLYRVDRKAKLPDIKGLDAQKRLDYLSGADISGIWDYTVSPFKGLDVLSDNPKPCRELIEALLKTAGREVAEKAKTSVKAGGAGPKASEAIAATKPITSAIPAAAKEATDKYAIPQGSIARTPAVTKNTAPVNYGPVPANSRLGQAMAAGQIEEGREPKGAGSGTVNFSQSAGAGNVGNLKIAGGPISSGESGMQYIKLNKDANIDGLHPRLKKHLMSMAQEYGEATGKSIPINEGFRSYERQAELYRKYGPGRAAKPGSSLHEFGLALDINTGVMNELEQMGLLRKYGFTRPIKGETWHTEPSGIQQAIQRAKTDPNFADAGILSSLGRGGGGAGSTPSQKIGGRNPALARAIYEANGGTSVDNSTTGEAGTTGAAAGQGNNLASPMVGGKAVIPAGEMKAMAGPGYASVGRGEGVQSSGNFSAAGSLGDGTGKYDAIKAQIAKYSQEAGADPNKMMLMAAMESSLNPNAMAKGTSAQGLMQFLGDTWDEQLGKHGKKYGLDAGRDNVRSQVILGNEYMKSNNNTIRKAVGRDLEMVDEYMGHFFGAGGASSLLRANPNALAASILPDSAAKNKEIFFDRGRARSVGEVRNFLNQRLQAKAKAFGIDLSGGDGSASGMTATAQEVDTPKAPTGSPIAYKPTFAVKAPLSPDRVAGFSADPTAPTMADIDAMKRRGNQATAGVMNRAQPMSMLAQGSSAGASRDTSVTATTEIMVRMTKSADEQVGYLKSIDSSITDKVVPLLQKIADNSAAFANQAGQEQGKPPADKSGIPGPASSGGPKKAEANKSSFDNRRSALTI